MPRTVLEGGGRAAIEKWGRDYAVVVAEEELLEKEKGHQEKYNNEKKELMKKTREKKVSRRKNISALR